jgi:hypothetical protein
MKLTRRAAINGTILLFAIGSAASAASFTVTVPGTSDPWLAGMPNGTTASGNDRAPAQSPVPVSGLSLARGAALRFTSTGGVGNSPVSPTYSAEGNILHIPPHGAGAENGIASITAPMNSLVGLFLGPDLPSVDAAPPALDFTLLLARDFASLRPALKQVFYIGDGRSTDGQIQEIIPPTGAMRLFLGTMDEWTWSDNIGSFVATVTETNMTVPASAVYDAAGDFSPFQGGMQCTWFYREFDGATFKDLVLQPAGNSFSGFQPAWTGADTALPMLFWEPSSPDTLIFHPGAPGGGPQPSRRDVVLTWVAPINGFHTIQGFIRGDSRFGIGGDGFEFTVFLQGEQLYQQEIAFDDKSRHGILLPHIYTRAGDQISFRVHDKGNNEYDVGAFNFTIRPAEPGLRIRVSQVEVCWDAEPGVPYQVEYRSTLTTNIWRPLNTNCSLGNGSVFCVSDAIPFGEPQRFYRLVTNCIP